MAVKKPPKFIYRQVPALLKPPKRSIQRALPTAIHIGITATFSILVFAIINMAVSYSLGPKAKWAGIVQAGTQMAMITITILAVPTLGKSFTKAVQRIAGVMAGGWLFYALYAGCQLWWFLAVCLAAWAFLLVSLSFLLTGQQYLSPVALITAFIVSVNFNTAEQALLNTAVKTVAISAAILVYTLAAMLLFPLTATQQVICSLSDALAALHSLAEVLLITGNGKQQQAAAADAAAAADSTAQVALDAKAASTSGAPADAGKPAKRQQVAGGAYSKAELLAAEAAHHLHTAYQLLPAMRKEKYVGKLGNCRCYVPTVGSGGLDDTKVLTATFSASQVLRALLIIMEEFGGVPMAERPAPAHLVNAAERALVKPLAHNAVAWLKDISASLPPSGPAARAVNYTNLAAFAESLNQLIAATLGSHSSHDAHSAAAAAAAAAASSSNSAAADPAAAAAVAAGSAGKWRLAAAAVGATVPLMGIDDQVGTRAYQIAVAFGQVLTDAVTSDEAQAARWCMMLVLSRQLGKALVGLTQSLDGLLPLLPGAPQGQQQQAHGTDLGNISGVATV